MLDGPDNTIYPEGEVVEMDPLAEQTIALVANGAIEISPEEPTIVTARYAVIRGPIENRQGEKFLTGNMIELPVDDDLTRAFLEGQMIVPEGTPEGEVVDSMAAAPVAPVEPGTPGDTEPRLRYRGQVVIDESIRTVGVQSFRHIRCADGVSYDLTEQEYRTQVYKSYPSEQ